MTALPSAPPRTRLPAALLAWAVGVLRAAGVASPGADAATLAAHVLGVPRSRLPAVGRFEPAQVERFGELVRSRSQRVPLQHLTGSAGFRYLTLAVGPGVFVPRPETETVAGFAIDVLTASGGRAHGAPVVVDLCTGSAAIALSVAHEVPGSAVHAVDVDERALAWARRNVAEAGLAVTLHRADVGIPGPARDADVPRVETVLAGLLGRVDCVVANPPYLADAERHVVEPEVGWHDPELALWAGPDGLDGLRAVAAVALRLLRPGGLFVAEHADAHGSVAPALVAAAGGWTDIIDHADLAGRPRFVTARRAGAEAGSAIEPAGGSAQFEGVHR